MSQAECGMCRRSRADVTVRRYGMVRIALCAECAAIVVLMHGGVRR